MIFFFLPQAITYLAFSSTIHTTMMAFPSILHSILSNTDISWGILEGKFELLLNLTFPLFNSCRKRNLHDHAARMLPLLQRTNYSNYNFPFQYNHRFPPPKKKHAAFMFLYIYVIHNTLQNYSFLKSHYTSAFWRQHISMSPSYFYDMWPFSAFWCTTLLFHHIKPKSMTYFNNYNALLINFHKCLYPQSPTRYWTTTCQLKTVKYIYKFCLIYPLDLKYFVLKSIVLD